MVDIVEIGESSDRPAGGHGSVGDLRESSGPADRPAIVQAGAFQREEVRDAVDNSAIGHVARPDSLAALRSLNDRGADPSRVVDSPAAEKVHPVARAKDGSAGEVVDGPDTGLAGQVLAVEGEHCNAVRGRSDA